MGLEFDSQEASSGEVIEAGDTAWTVVDGLHEYDCDKGVFVPYTAGLRIINDKFSHGSKADQWAVYVTSGPQILVAHNKFDALDGVTGGGCYFGGQFAQFHGNQIEDCNPGVRAGAGPHTDDGYGNDVSHNRFRNLPGVTALDVAATGSPNKLRYTTLLGNTFKGGGQNVVDSGENTYRRDALAPSG